MTNALVRFLTFTTLAGGAFVSVAAGCGGGDGDRAGFVPQGGDALADGGPADGGHVDLGAAWPTVDPTPNDVPHGGPAFVPDAMTPGAPSCAPHGGKPGDSVITMDFGGITRIARLHVPPGYVATTGAPLVLNFHGFGSDAPQEELLSRMDAAADLRGAIVAYPCGVAASWNAGKCCGTSWVNAVDDTGFVRALVKRIATELCVDARRIYATGMSNGGFLSHRLGCEASDLFAAIAPVAGVLGVPFDSCAPVNAVPVLAFHGTKDPIVPYAGGNPIIDIGAQGATNFPSVASSIARWREIDGCSGDQETVYQKGDATCVRWPKCKGGSEVGLCTIDGGGHTWPGGVPIPVVGKTSVDLSATDAMFAFFAAHYR